MIRKALLATFLPLVACAHAPAQDAAEVEAAPAEMIKEVTPPDPSFVETLATMGGDIIGMDGSVIGRMTLTEGPNGLMIEALVEPGGLTPGWHGLHLHQVGDCSDVGVFKKSGGHMGLIPGGHGLHNPVGPESGDITNIWAAADGSAGYEVFNTFATLADITDEDGTAMIIHQNRDDHITQPIGGAGPRVACAVIE